MGSARRLVVALAVTVTLVLAGCGGGSDRAADPTPYVELDGSARHPNAAGVVTKVAKDFSTIEIDGKQTYDVAKDLQCFATQDGTTLPLRQQVGAYVHLGLKGKTVVWLATIADVVDAPPAQPVVYYVGDLTDLLADGLVFRDGTVLRVATSLHLPAPPKSGAHIVVSIDPGQDAVIEVNPA